jgi:Gpi18-like mannosyltransferase
VLIFFRKRRIGNGEILLLATLSVFLVPFFLPSMHERYFYPADIFSILLVFYYPELFLVPIFSQLSSFFTYQPFLTDKYVFPLSVLSFLNLASIVFLTRKAIFLLYLQKPRMKKKPLLHV